MPTADYSSYHQPPGTGGDGTKLDNFIDAVQATVNALDKNNLAASAGILASQLADPTTGKVLGSSGAACAAVFPPGYQWQYDQATSAATITSTSEGSPSDVIVGSAVTLDGTDVFVEAYIPNVNSSTASITAHLTLWDGSTDLGRVWESFIGSAGSGNFPGVFVKTKVAAPSVGSHTFKLRGWVSGAATITANMGAGGAGAYRPGWIRVVKA